MKNQSSNVRWQPSKISRSEREAVNGHRGFIIWLTGLSGSGKTTLAHALEQELFKMGCKTFVLDGDNMRHGLCGDLGFSVQDRDENIRRVGEVAKILMDAGIIVVTAFISPLLAHRDFARSIVGKSDFAEVYCNSTLDVCERRDVKGLYKKARSGELKEFTGISSPYEAPKNPDLILNTGVDALEVCVNNLLLMISERKVIHLTSMI